MSSESSLIELIDDLCAQCAIVEDNINHALSSDRDFFHLVVALEEMQMAIQRAIAGEAPDFLVWGPLRADEFLQIVRDVTSWALTNFEAFRARPAAEESPTGILQTAWPYFGKATRFQPPFNSVGGVRALSSVNDPAIRCPALWWAHVLLAESHRCRNPSEMGLPARQWSLLQSQCPAGLHWLMERMTHWPADYARQYWTPLESLLFSRG
jgi:hypothetical protein